LQELYEQYSGQGLKVVAVNIYPDQDEMVDDWAESHGITFPVLVGADLNALIDSYRVMSTPLSFLLNEEGLVIARMEGYYPGAEEELEVKIRSVLGS
jgi:hypothetical protein